MDVDLHYQLSVAKRMNTQSWNSTNRVKAKVSGAVGVPTVGRELFEDAQ